MGWSAETWTTLPERRQPLFVAEGLEFCLEAGPVPVRPDELEALLAGRVWGSRSGLPERLLVTRWNGFTRLGRTTIFQFFVPHDSDPAFTVNQGPDDQCRLRPYIDKWAGDLGAATWGRFEDRYTQEPFLLLLKDNVVIYYANYRFDSGSIPDWPIKDTDLPNRVAPAPEYLSFVEGGMYLDFDD
jgi:hypothetical protein